MAFESALKNLTIDGINAASQVGADDTVTPGTVEQLPEWQSAVLCTDIPYIYNKTYQALKPHIGTLEGQSFLGGEVWTGFLVGINHKFPLTLANCAQVNCTGWPIKAKWRFSGPFGAKTKNPILFISNTIDPATPMENSVKWSPRFIGSEILTIEAVGHTSLAAQNGCAASKMGHFFQTGKLPGPGAVCKAEPGAFGLTIDISSASLYR